ncbi:MAG: restriction endonuclease subunit M [Planctomycetaceae bacterium]|nr:restriction endonuclease subunit M [Planctomycetaceae bacterium]
MQAPPAVLELVNRFELHRESYLAQNYNETQLRREFVDPFFKALGWDIDNESGYAEAYKDVIHEDAIKIAGATKAPDYCFRVGGVRKFFVETKKPSVNVKDDPSGAFQLRRYAWTAKLPLSILTDFEEFAVYECLRHKPHQNDKASRNRILYLKYTEYADRWDELTSLFSREAILKGAFDKYADTNGKKRGTAEVDAEFLKEIEAWRDLLARNLAVRNPELSQRDLNFAVQRTIDRIVFLRICEDRGIEKSGQLQALTNGPKIYQRLCRLFEHADDRYNSGLFHFQKERDRREPPDELTLSLSIDDGTLKQIIHSLYYPDCPYEFSVLPADILGQVYEQFLGKVIRLTKGHQAKVEEKPEVKKAGGVFYTPTYVVRHIVENTLAALLEGANPQHVGKIRILDPACGSGSFLIEVYQTLVDWHRDYYVAHGPSRHAKQVYQGSRGGWRLTTAEKKRILLNNIYGVDIDPQAVEVTKLSLLLKVLEGESQESLSRQLRIFRERALPDLESNIKCGNALIGPDFFNGRHMGLIEDDDLMRLNVFDWAAEFPEIMRAGGFSAIVGNPPYVRMELFKDIKDYLRKHYATHAERNDLYVYFIERELSLLRTGGRLGMIVSNKFIRANYGEPLRKHLAAVATIERIVDLAGLPVFSGATVRTVVLLAKKGRQRGARPAVLYSPPPTREELIQVQTGTRKLVDVADPLAYKVAARELGESGWRLIRPACAALLDRLKADTITLHEFTGGRICMGIKSGLIDAFVITPQQRRAIIARNPKASQIIRPFAQGRQIRRYAMAPIDEYLIYTHHGIDIEPYPAVIEHLRPFREELEARATQQQWYELQQPQFAYVSFMEQPKIMFPDIATGCRFALDTEGRFGANTVYFIPLNDPALLGLLNSRLAFFFFQQTCAALEGPGAAYLRFFGQYLEGFPVRIPAEGTPNHNRLRELAITIESLYCEHRAARTAHHKTTIERQIAAVDNQIDKLVYALYELAEDDIRLVEQVGDLASGEMACKLPESESNGSEVSEEAGDD